MCRSASLLPPFFFSSTGRQVMMSRVIFTIKISKMDNNHKPQTTVIPHKTRPVITNFWQRPFQVPACVLKSCDECQMLGKSVKKKCFLSTAGWRSSVNHFDPRWLRCAVCLYRFRQREFGANLCSIRIQSVLSATGLEGQSLCISLMSVCLYMLHMCWWGFLYRYKRAAAPYLSK